MSKKDDELLDRESLGGSAYDQQHFSDDELRNAAEIRAAAQSGKTSWEDAHSFVENIRGGYGYSGDSDGSKYIKLPGAEDRDFSYASAPSYSNKYQGKIDELTSAILGRDPFSYDHTKDDTYKQYEQSYTRNGERAMQDTLGQVSARTGGLASSYAASASQQTYDGYMAALSDKIPELKQLAYSMYQDEGNNQRANLEMLMALEQGDFNKYQSLLGQYNNDRSFNYGAFSDDKNFDYGVSRDELADKRYDDETSYGREQDNWEKSNCFSEKEYNQALQKAQTLGAAGDFSGFKALGYTDAEIGNLKSAYHKAQAGTGRGGSSGGGSSGNSSGGIVETMVGMGSDTKAYEYLLGLDMSNAKTEQIWSMYESSRGDESTGGDKDDTRTSSSNGGYGSSYNSIWGRARTMFDQGRSTQNIMDYLDKFNDTQLTDVGLDYIMSSLNLNGYRGDGGKS